MTNEQLTVHIEVLQRAREEELKSRKYVHNMLEDMGAKMNDLQRSSDRCESDREHRNRKERELNEWLATIESHQRTIERMVWIGVGGVIILGGVITLIGRRIMEILI